MNRSTKARRAARRRRWEQATFALNARSPPRLDGIAAYYDPWGRIVGLGTWAVWFGTRGPERFIAHDYLPNGYRVSTVWTGMNHGLPRAFPPLIFATGVFRTRPGEPLGARLEERHYSTRRDALAGHREIVERYRNRPEAANDGDR